MASSSTGPALGQSTQEEDNLSKFHSDTIRNVTALSVFEESCPQQQQQQEQQNDY